MIEILAVILTLASVWLAARQSILNWPVGIVAVCCFGVVFWEKALFAAAALQVIYVVQSAWGWWAWSRPQGAVQRMDGEDFAHWIELLIWGTGAAYLVLVPCGSPSPFLDAFAFCLSILATYLLTYRYVESWLVWMAVNLTYLVLFASQAMWPTAALSLTLLVVNLFAYRSWRRALV